MSRKLLTIRLEPELHKTFKLQAVQDGRSMEALIRGWIESYLDGEKMTEPLAQIVIEADRPVTELPDTYVAPVAQEPLASRKASGKRTDMCIHRVPAGSFCKKCDG